MVFKEKIAEIGDYRNFARCDHCILNLLHQLFIDKDNSELSQWPQILTQWKQVFEHLAVILVTPQGQVRISYNEESKSFCQS